MTEIQGCSEKAQSEDQIGFKSTLKLEKLTVKIIQSKLLLKTCHKKKNATKKLLQKLCTNCKKDEQHESSAKVKPKNI